MALTEMTLLHATRQAAAASLAGGIIAASGKPHSMQEAMRVFKDAFWTLYPDNSSNAYIDWLSEHSPTTPYGEK